MITRLTAEQSALVEQHYPLARSYATKHVLPHEDRRELAQVGAVGLMRAVQKFDPSKGFQFSTYATWWIIKSVKRWRLRQDLVHVPEYQKSRKVQRRRYRKFAFHARNPYLSLDERVGQDRWDCLIDPRSIAEEPLYDEDDLDWLARALRTLGVRERVVLQLRYQGLPYVEIGVVLGVSRERVRQLVVRALGKLQVLGEKRKEELP